MRAIRSHEGSQARAWEELAYQLRPPTGVGHLQTRKTRAPDAGVEWYEVFADGHEEGFQAKFHARLQDALGGMRESVEAVCSKRPNLTKLTFVLPYDFTDSGTADTTTDQDRWDAAVARWQADIPGASRVEFATVRAGDVTAKLSLKEHAGRREYWFCGLELTDEWLRDRFSESVRVAGQRYTPQADSASAVNAIIDGVASGPTFLAEVNSLALRASGAARQDFGMWGTSDAAASSLIDKLDEARSASFWSTVSDGEALAADTPDLAGMAGIADELLALAQAQRGSLPRSDGSILDAAISALDALRVLVGGLAATAMTRRAIALTGPAGQGKTHALMRAVDGCLERGAPALAILGQRLSDRNWWPAVAESLGGMTVTSDEFLQALDTMAEARRCRALVVVDAINESQSPGRWRDELPAMLAQFERYRHVAVVVSYRADYRDIVGSPDSLLKVHHPGIAGHEDEALAAYCRLFNIQVPTKALFEPAFSSPLFLRMYCEVIAADPDGSSEAPARSKLFERYAEVIGKKVAGKLDLPPTSPVVGDAVSFVADRLLANSGQPVPRNPTEEQVDALLPGRTWPNSLFQQMASEGLIELRPTYDGTESVAFPFQAYSEHLLARRLITSVDAEARSWLRRLVPLPQEARRRRRLAKCVAGAPWAWRSLAVSLPEREHIELVDLLPATMDDFRLQEATRESLIDRATSAFGDRALDLLRHFGTDPSGDANGIETVLALAPRDGHPGNADWLHQQLVGLSMADRDSTWSIATYQVDQYSDAYRRITRWSDRLSHASSYEEVRLASTALMWLLTSPNRFLRDGASKTLVKLLSHHLGVSAYLVKTAQQIDEPYVQERVLTCSYGAVLVGGDADLIGVRSLLDAASAWCQEALPIDVIARDSVRGIASWCADRGLLDKDALSNFEPPYGASPPDEPPTREELGTAHGPLKDAEGNYIEWRASSILHSCLDWHGDFNKYVVRSDVEFFSRHPLSGLAPTGKDRDNPLDEVDVNWAGRWIANRAISMGWTTERFEAFESDHDLAQGRDAHKAERFGKKYQWIAHRELLARLADNFYPSYETWSSTQNTYQGPWAWYGRDFDPTLPPSVLAAESRVCRVAHDPTGGWAALPSPDMDIIANADQWVAMADDLPDAASMFTCTDSSGRRWVAIQRYSTWDRSNAQRTGMSKRERDVFFLQFSWLVPQGQGSELRDFIEREGLSGRWMPDTKRTYQQYLGETSSAPIVTTIDPDIEDFPHKLLELGLRPRPAVEQYLWEGNTLDCSIDESIDLYAPTPELLGSARWEGFRAEWALDGQVVARALEYPDGGNSQRMLLVDADWLATRLRSLNADMVIGTQSERHALPLDDDDYRHMAFSDIWYAAVVTPDVHAQGFGPLFRVRRLVED